MPLPTDEQLIANAKEVIALFHQAFGPHPGFRPGHAKGQLVRGTFVPTKAAGDLSRAEHFHAASTPVTVRFSNSTGLPLIPDGDPHAEPRGAALRFHLADDKTTGHRRHTDVIGHSVPAFPARNGVEFAHFLRAIGGSEAELGAYLEKNPPAKTFLTYPKPLTQSFATTPYFALTAYKFVNKDGKETYIRYELEPVAGIHTLPEGTDVKGLDPEYLFKELATRLKAGTAAAAAAQGPVKFKLVAQLANEGDPTDDISLQWSQAGHRKVELGTVTLETLVDDNATEQKHVIFDPIPRVDGIEPSADPMLEFRAAVYLLSGRERRAA
ncbi:hypothetical protein DFQ26_001829 [Actinomortierella ambigua]|nr:hypothetical protein DFQ26_001829 [Actinomortierella ambigua]